MIIDLQIKPQEFECIEACIIVWKRSGGHG